MPDKADEEAGLTPSDEDNAVRRKICPQKPCLPLSTDGMRQKGYNCGLVLCLYCNMSRAKLQERSSLSVDSRALPVLKLFRRKAIPFSERTHLT